jgi:hypothetical protein
MHTLYSVNVVNSQFANYDKSGIAKAALTTDSILTMQIPIPMYGKPKYGQILFSGSEFGEFQIDDSTMHIDSHGLGIKRDVDIQLYTNRYDFLHTFFLHPNDVDDEVQESKFVTESDDNMVSLEIGTIDGLNTSGGLQNYRDITVNLNRNPNRPIADLILNLLDSFGVGKCTILNEDANSVKIRTVVADVPSDEVFNLPEENERIYYTLNKENKYTDLYYDRSAHLENRISNIVFNKAN